MIIATTIQIGAQDETGIAGVRAGVPASGNDEAGLATASSDANSTSGSDWKSILHSFGAMVETGTSQKTGSNGVSSLGLNSLQGDKAGFVSSMQKLTASQVLKGAVFKASPAAPAKDADKADSGNKPDRIREKPDATDAKAGHQQDGTTLNAAAQVVAVEPPVRLYTPATRSAQLPGPKEESASAPEQLQVDWIATAGTERAEGGGHERSLPIAPAEKETVSTVTLGNENQITPPEVKTALPDPAVTADGTRAAADLGTPGSSHPVSPENGPTGRTGPFTASLTAGSANAATAPGAPPQGRPVGPSGLRAAEQAKKRDTKVGRMNSADLVAVGAKISGTGSEQGLNVLAFRDPNSPAKESAPESSEGVAENGPGSLSVNDTFANLDAARSSLSTTWIHAGAHHAEAGYLDPSLGWVSVRADAVGSGVHAAVLPSSSGAAQVISSQLGGLNAYLAEHHPQPATVTMGSPQDSAGATGGGQGNSASHGNAGESGANRNHDDVEGRETFSARPAAVRETSPAGHSAVRNWPVVNAPCHHISLMA